MKLLFCVCLALSATAAPFDATAAFARLRSLSGEWEASTPTGKFHVTYEVIAGGTAVVERDRGEGMPEMLTVYHMDGKRLLLTHYCMTGNQPRMEAQAFDPASGEIQFRFLDATNLTSPAAGHMRNATIRLTDARHFSSNWEFFEDGKIRNTEKFDYTRVR